MPTETHITTPIALTGDQRSHALKVANALVKAGYDESLAVPRAIAEAWTMSQTGEESFEVLDAATPGPAIHVHYNQGHWHVTSNDPDFMDKRFNQLEDALSNAYKEVVESNSAIYVHNTAGLVERIDPEAREMTVSLYFYVAPHKDGWCVSRLGASEGYFKHFKTKKEALKHAREHARDNVARLIVQNSDGEPINNYDYGQA